MLLLWAGELSRYSDWLRAGRSGDRIPVDGEIFRTSPDRPWGPHPASCKMGTGSFPRVKSGRGVTLTPHPLLVPWSRKNRAIPLLPLWAVRPVQSLSACTRVHFNFYLFCSCCPLAIIMYFLSLHLSVHIRLVCLVEASIAFWSTLVSRLVKTSSTYCSHYDLFNDTRARSLPSAVNLHVVPRGS